MKENRMETFDVVATKLDVKDFDPSKKVPKDIKMKVLEAARLTGSGMNAQHWRFILIQEPDTLKQLADDSTTGKWVKNCAFAVIILTNPKLGFYQIDAGRATQNMQVTAWSYGVASRIFTGIDKPRLKSDFGIPEEFDPTAVVGFGYPANKVTGKKKDRMPISEVAFVGRFGNKLDPNKVT